MDTEFAKQNPNVPFIGAGNVLLETQQIQERGTSVSTNKVREKGTDRGIQIKVNLCSG